MSAVARPAVAWQFVLLAIWQQRRNQGAMWFWYALAIALCAGAAGLALLPRVSAFWAATTLLATFAFGGWIWLVNGLALQNEPHAARLVPGHVRTLRRVLAAAGAVIAAGAALVGAAAGHALLVGGATVLALIVVAWVARVPTLGLFLWIVPATSSHWSNAALFGALVEAATAAYRAQPGLVAAGLAALLLAAALASLPMLLQDGGAGHQRSHRQRVRSRTLLRTGRADSLRWASAGRFGGALRGLSTVPYRAVLARAIAARGGSVLGRALVGLGPNLHWSGVLGAGLFGGAMMLGIGWLVITLALTGPHGANVRPASWWPVSIAVLGFVVGAGLAARTALHHTRREQALLMLLPGMPRGAALNRELAWRLLAQFVAIWAAALAVCAFFLPPHGHQIGWIATLAFTSLPMGALLWRDWSALRAPTALSPAAPVFATMAITVALIALQAAFDLPFWPFAAGGVVAMVALLAWRWRVVMNAPAAFPAGRRA